MYVTVKKSTLILFSVLGALLIAGLCAGVLCLDLSRRSHREALEQETAAEWRRGVSELSSALQQLETDLQKGLFASGEYQAVSWAARVFAEAGAARTALETLPLYESRLGNTEEYLNQVGEFTLAAARKRLRGETLSEEEGASLRRLALRAREISEEILSFSEKITDENTGYADLLPHLSPSGEGEDETVFESLENLFSQDGPLIYDGAHSDWYESRKSAWLEGLPLPEEESDLVRAAADALGVADGDLVQLGRYEFPFPLREYGVGEDTVAVSERGGKPVGFARTREVTVSRLSVEEGLEAGSRALEALGYSSMEPVLWSRSGHLLHGVYAARSEGVLIYGDRITVTVALDDGSLLSVNAMEYLLSHNPDRALRPTLSSQDAAKALRPELAVSGTGLAMLTGGDGAETLCWQFTVTDPLLGQEGAAGPRGTGSEEKALVFVNAHTGVEQEIFLAPEGEDFRILQ